MIISSSIFIRVLCVVCMYIIGKIKKIIIVFFIIFFVKLIICFEDMIKGVGNWMVKFRVVMLIVYFKIYLYMMI